MEYEKNLPYDMVGIKALFIPQDLHIADWTAFYLISASYRYVRLADAMKHLTCKSKSRLIEVFAKYGYPTGNKREIPAAKFIGICEAIEAHIAEVLESRFERKKRLADTRSLLMKNRQYTGNSIRQLRALGIVA